MYLSSATDFHHLNSIRLSLELKSLRLVLVDRRFGHFQSLNAANAVPKMQKWGINYVMPLYPLTPHLLHKQMLFITLPVAPSPSIECFQFLCLDAAPLRPCIR